MFKLELSNFDRETFEVAEPQKVAWSNLKQSIGTDFVFILSTIGWLKANPSKTLADLDAELRSKDLPVRLFADVVPEGKVAVDARDTSKSLPHVLGISFDKDYDSTIAEKFGSLEENQRLLSTETGFSCDKVNDKAKALYDFTDAFKSIALKDVETTDDGIELSTNIHLVMYNLVNIRTTLSKMNSEAVDHINEVARKYREAGKEVVGVKLQTTEQGGSIVGFRGKDDESFLTDVGVRIERGEDGNDVMTTVSLRDLEQA